MKQVIFAIPLVLAVCSQQEDDSVAADGAKEVHTPAATAQASARPDTTADAVRSPNGPLPGDADESAQPNDPPLSPGRFDASSQVARFGPADSESVLTLSCKSGANGKSVVVVAWNRPAQADEIQDLGLYTSQGNGLVRISAAPATMGPGYFWRGEFGAADPAAAVFRRQGQIVLRPETGAPLTINGAESARAINACFSG